MSPALMLVQRHRTAPAAAQHSAARKTMPPRAAAGVPRFLAGARSRQAESDIARAGTQAAGQPLPHRDRLEAAFGAEHDLSSVQAHLGPDSAYACEGLGAAAFAAGEAVAFRSTPGLWLAAHEAAHVVQQRHGIPTGGIDAAGNVYERQADAVANRVVAGESARDLLPRGGRRGGSATALVQRYSVENTRAGSAQIGQGRQTALVADQELYAASGTISDANSKLQSAGKSGSYIELKAASGSVDVDGTSLVKVQPEFLVKPGSKHAAVAKANAPGGKDTEGTANGPMALWTDCGRSSATVTGSAGWGDRSVVYVDNGVAKLGKGVDDATVSKWLKGESNQMANQVYMELMPRFIARPDNASHVVEGVHYDLENNTVKGALVGGAAGVQLGAIGGSLLGGIGAGPGAVIGGVIGAVRGGIEGSTQMTKVFRKPATIADAKLMYLALGNAGMDKFDKEAGINFYADPEVGESYSMATEGDMPGFKSFPDEKTWNYHWAGVVMKDGTDNITLENYAVTAKYAASKGVGQYDFIDRAWNFAMYGTTDSKQTFHHEHLASRTHGSHATSIAVRTDK